MKSTRALAILLAVSALLAASVAQESPLDFFKSPPARVLEGRFATHGVCATCHTPTEEAKALRDAVGRSVSPVELWRGSMMANSARDPLWRAQVAAEVAAVGSAVVAECLTCHAPMAAHEARLNGEPPPGIDVLSDPGPRGALARDGASCAACHQIQDRGLGTRETFGGALPIGDERLIYGPHADVVTMPMRRNANYTPTHSPHVLKSALCATCHTLFTGHDKTVPEQTPYLEWRNSVFQDEVAPVGSEARTCQSCHLPTSDLDGAPLETRLARMPVGRDFPFTKPRGPIGRHVFVGGNVLVPAIFRDHGQELGTEAPRAAFEETLRLAREQLEQRTARVTIEGAARTADRITGRVRVENLTGHKLPTGIPVRRTWLRVRVWQGERVVIAVGEHDMTGHIRGADGLPLPAELAGGPFYPHRDVVQSPADVPVYEAVLADAAGNATYRLRLATGHLKDNRLLPRGWKPDHPDATPAAPVGVEGDPDFAGGGDVVRLDLPLDANATGPLRLEAQLLYQPLSSRWAAELFTVDAPEVARFKGYWDRADRTPVVTGSATVELP